MKPKVKKRIEEFDVESLFSETHTLVEVIHDLMRTYTRMTEMGYSNITHEYDQYNNVVRFYGMIEETEEETNNRIKRQQEIEAREREQFEKLKAKFEKCDK